MKASNSLVKRTLGATLLVLMVINVVPSHRVFAEAPVALQVDVTPIAPVDLADIEGGGWLQRLACVGCVAGVIGMAGGSIAGLTLVAGVFPYAFSACALGCASEFFGDQLH